MNIETIVHEIRNNGSRKIVLGVRCFPELKNKLSQEATELGISMSEHSENILLNKDKTIEEIKALETKTPFLGSLDHAPPHNHLALSTRPETRV